MTKKKLNTYTPEFKESAIKLALDSDERTSHDFLRKVRRGLF
jgi:transposase-like protein